VYITDPTVARIYRDMLITPAKNMARVKTPRNLSGGDVSSSDDEDGESVAARKESVGMQL
jgi:hypothetical protein